MKNDNSVKTFRSLHVYLHEMNVELHNRQPWFKHDAVNTTYHETDKAVKNNSIVNVYTTIPEFISFAVFNFISIYDGINVYNLTFDRCAHIENIWEAFKCGVFDEYRTYIDGIKNPPIEYCGF